MTGREIFEIWAPTKGKWTDWIRPVPFIGINDNYKEYQLNDFEVPKILYLEKVENDTAIIVDLPENESIEEGIGLAKIGFRPIPIFNGTDEQEGANATVNNKIIKWGLIKGALELEKIKIEQNANPVFLLDSNRMNRYKMNESIFDNSWDIYAQDLPTAEYFLENEIKKIILRSNKIERDVNDIFYKFRKKGIEILFTNGYEKPKYAKLKKPKTKAIDEI